jgi:NADH-quinone oxidoreductase subunit I
MSEPLDSQQLAESLPPRTRGVIALLEENCTVCMLCARECPDWCIYIEAHKETTPPSGPGGRERQRNVLDRFAIDFSLCMYCGICVEVCPFDALFWSPAFAYSGDSLQELTHEAPQLRDWLAAVPAPPATERPLPLAGPPVAPSAGASS